jgi:hypothetical protein
MTEDAEITRLNIRHYQELLKLDRHTAETRQRLIELVAEAEAQLPCADADQVASSGDYNSRNT